MGNRYPDKSVYIRTTSRRDWYSEHVPARTCDGVLIFDPRCVGDIFFFFRAGYARKCEHSDPCVDFYITPSCIAIVYCLNF